MKWQVSNEYVDLILEWADVTDCIYAIIDL